MPNATSKLSQTKVHRCVIKMHGHMSAAKKVVRHTSVSFTGITNSPFSTPPISITTESISIHFTYFMPSIYMTLHTKFEGNQPSNLLDMCSRKLPQFLHIFLLCNINMSQPKIPFSWIDFFQIWHTNKVLCGLS